ncbi:aldehyde ferredoxin oxidoreductase N-terminal domain-containing protein [Desulfonatronovibrio magnus]|uniref:aldehyde ferredoxin oxidoreductase N-terminal domain-containing protein n=1 Tax=Desulfonatronovibrio magnus TaxID=698827 RepID=UPI0018DB457C|nr:aldehyde ferredoxin oxidoreductase N-terminal domain-containing protein [Desulfonatronovibrio magnus]
MSKSETNRQAGRSGPGAVMDSKNLKAIALRGPRGTPGMGLAYMTAFAKNWGRAGREI